jgi:hypothetical protein
VCHQQQHHCASLSIASLGSSLTLSWAVRLQFKRQLLKEEAALRVYDKATDGELRVFKCAVVTQPTWHSVLNGEIHYQPHKSCMSSRCILHDVAGPGTGEVSCLALCQTLTTCKVQVVASLADCYFLPSTALHSPPTLNGAQQGKVPSLWAERKWGVSAEILKVTDDSLSAFPRVWRKAEEQGIGATLPEEDITKAAPTSKGLAAHPSKKFVLVSGLQIAVSQTLLANIIAARGSHHQAGHSAKVLAAPLQEVSPGELAP